MRRSVFRGKLFYKFLAVMYPLLIFSRKEGSMEICDMLFTTGSGARERASAL